MPGPDFEATLKFDLLEHYSFYMTCHAHGWKNLSPFRWNDESQTLYFAVYLDDQPVDITAWQKGDLIEASLISHSKLSQDHIKKAKELISRALCLATDTDDLLNTAERIDPDCAKLIKKGAGRLLHAPTLWEDAAKTLFTTNCSWVLTKKMCEAVCSKTFSDRTPSGIYPFPPPQKFIKFSVGKLKSLMPIGYRAEYFIALSKNFSKDPKLDNIESNGFNHIEAHNCVKQLRGFGDYAIAHLLVLAGYYNEIPIDTVVVSYLKENYRVRKPKSFIDRKYRKWGKYKWWGLKLEKILRHQNWLGD